MAVRQDPIAPIADAGVGRVRVARGDTQTPQAVADIAGLLFDVRDQGIKKDFAEDVIAADQDRIAELDQMTADQHDIVAAAVDVAKRSDGEAISGPVKSYLRIAARNEAALEQGIMSEQEVTNRNSSLTSDYISRYPHLADDIIKLSSRHNSFSGVAAEVARLEQGLITQAERDQQTLEQIDRTAETLGINKINYGGRTADYFGAIERASTSREALSVAQRKAETLNANNQYDSGVATKNARSVVPEIYDTAAGFVESSVLNLTQMGDVNDVAAIIKDNPAMFEQLRRGLQVQWSNYKLNQRTALDPNFAIPEEEWNKIMGEGDKLIEAGLRTLTIGDYSGRMAATGEILGTSALLGSDTNVFAAMKVSDQLSKMAAAGILTSTVEALKVGDVLTGALSDILLSNEGESTRTYGATTNKNGSLRTPRGPGDKRFLEQSGMTENEAVSTLLKVQDDNRLALLGQSTGVLAEDPEFAKSVTTSTANSLLKFSREHADELESGGGLMSEQLRDAYLGVVALPEFYTEYKAFPVELKREIHGPAFRMWTTELKQLINVDMPLLMKPQLDRLGIIRDKQGSRSVWDTMLKYIGRAGTGSAPVPNALLTPADQPDDEFTKVPAQKLISVSANPATGQVSFEIDSGGFNLTPNESEKMTAIVEELNATIAPVMTNMTRGITHLNMGSGPDSANPNYSSGWAALAAPTLSGTPFEVKVK